MLEVIVKMRVQPLGCTRDTVRELVDHALPEYVTAHGYTISISEAHVESIEEVEDHDMVPASPEPCS